VTSALTALACHQAALAEVLGELFPARPAFFEEHLLPVGHGDALELPTLFFLASSCRHRR
jgi:hypothetical protein